MVNDELTDFARFRFGGAAEVDKFVQKVLAETPANVEEVIIEKAEEDLNLYGNNPGNPSKIWENDEKN